MPSTLLVSFLFLLICHFSSSLVWHSEFSINTPDDVSLYTIHFYNVGEEKTKGKTVLIRTPYGSSTKSHYARHLLEGHHAKHVVMQDLRGTHKSSGLFLFFNKTSSDSLTTIDWIKSQSFYDGTIFTSGASALAITQYLDPLLIQSPLITAQCMYVGTGLLYELVYTSGAFRQGDVQFWIGQMAGKLTDFVIDLLLMHETFSSSFYAGVELDQFSKHVDWPSLHIGGWFDPFQDGTIDSFGLYDGQMKGEKTALVVGTGGHCEGKSAITFPNASFATDEELCPSFFDNADKLDMGRKITLYVMGPNSIPYGSKGGNYWISGPTWPNVTYEQLYLNSETMSLASECSASGSNATFTYDPNNPTPTLGGNNLPHSGMPCGCQDMSKAEARSDNMVFTGENVKDYVAIVGHIIANLYVSSDRNDTDFMVRLTDVYPDGRSMLIRNGLVRMRWRNGKNEPMSLIALNQVYATKIDLWSVAYILNPGHRFRVSITSSDFPRVSANPNNGNLVLDGGELLVAENVVYTGGDEGCSSVVLPVVSLDELENHRI